MRPVSSWAVLTGYLLQWLATPPLIVIPLLALVVLAWAVPSLRRKRWPATVPIFLLIVYFGAASPLVVSLVERELTRFSTADAAWEADAIVVLGRGSVLRNSRVDVATRLWQAGRAPRVFASGRGDATETVRLLRSQGIPARSVMGEECSRTTEENARFSATLLQAQGVRRILLVTDAPHMRRSLLTFRRFGFVAGAYASPTDSEVPERLRSLIALREYLGLLSYGLQGRLAQRPLNHH